MAISGWRGWLNDLARTINGKRGRREERRSAAAARARRLELERLEERLAPATNISIFTGAAGTGALDHFLSASNGTITTANDPGDLSATLSTGALASVGAGVNISIAADNSITFDALNILTLQTGAGASDTFTTTNGAISFVNTADTIVTGGASLVFSAGTNLSVGNLNSNGGAASLTAGTAGAGNIVVNALSGTTVNLTSNGGSISSLGSSAVQASGQLTLAAATGVTLNILAAQLAAVNSTSGNISIVQSASPIQTLTIAGAGVINNAAGGAVSVANLGAGITVGGGSSVSTASNGAITLAATDFTLLGAINSGAGVTTLANSTAGRQIDLGTNTSGKIGLTQAELNTITAGTLRIGSATAGAINVSTSIAPPNSTPLDLINNDVIGEAAGVSLNVPSLAILSTGPVTLNNVNDVGTLAANTTNAFSLDDGTNSLTIGTVDGLPGVTTNNSAVTLTADNIVLTKPINAGAAPLGGVVTLQPFSSALPIQLGAASVAATSFGLTDAGLSNVTAGVLRVGGSGDTGGIAVVGAVTRHAGFSTLSLITGNTTANAVTQTAALSVANLAVQSAGAVTLTNAGNDADVLASSVAAGTFSYTDANSVTVGGPIDGVTGVTTTNAVVAISAGGNLTLAQAVNAGAARVTLTAGAAIVNANGAANEVTAGQLSAQAVSGIGTALAPINTAVANIAAQTATGGIAFNNTGALTIGFTGEPFAGVQVTTSGAIQITDNNTVSVTTHGDIVNAPGDVTITANGTSSNIVTGGNNSPAVESTGGGAVTLTAGQDLVLGGPANGNPGDVASYGGGAASISLTAGRDILVSGGSLVNLAGGSTGAGITANAGRNISITGNGGVNGPSQFTANPAGGDSGPISLTAQGSFTANVGAGIDAVASGGGAITIAANTMTLSSGIDASTNGAGGAPVGIVTLEQATPTRNIDLGTNPSSGNLGLSTSDLSHVTAGVLRIGSTANSGNISVTAAIASQTGWSTLSLLSNGTITQQAAGTLAVTKLAAQGGAGVTLTNALNNVGTLAGGTTGNAAAFSFTDGAGLTLTVGAVDSFTGVVTSGSGNINLTADDEALNAAVNAGTGTVTITPTTPTRAINLGTNTAGQLGLTNAELNEVSAGVLRIGLLPNFTGNITVSANVSPANIGALSLQTSGSGVISEGANKITVAAGTGGLAVQAATAVSLGGSNSVGTLAANLTGAAQGFGFTNAGALTIGTVDGVAGVTTNGGTVLVQTTAGGVTVGNNVSAGAAAVTLTAGGANNTITNNATIGNTGGNSITLIGDRMALQGGTISAANGGRVILAPTTAGQLLNLGSTVDTTANTLELSDAELQTVATTGVLQIGQAGGFGNVTVSAPVNAANVGTLTLITSGSVGGAGTVAVAAGTGALDVQAGNAVSLSGVNSVAVLAGSVANMGQGFTFNNAGGLVVNSVDGVSGVATNGGVVTIGTSAGNLSVDKTVSAGAATVNLTAGGLDSFLTNNASITGASANFTADRMALAGGTIAFANIVTLQAGSVGRPINIGAVTDPTGTLNLSAAELNTITAGVVRIGGAGAGGSGNLQVSATITPTSFNTLTLLSHGAITEPGGEITVANLAVQGDAGVALTTGVPTNTVTNLAGAATIAGAGFSFSNSAALTVGTVDTLSGITTSSGAVNLTLYSNGTGPLTVNSAISTNGAAISLQADDMALNAAVNAGASSAVVLSVFHSNQSVDLGTNTVGELGLTQAELNNITAGFLSVHTPANITVSAAVVAPATWNNLSLFAAGTITEGVSGSLNVATLGLHSAGATLTSAANQVTTLGFTNTSGALNFTDSVALTIAAVTDPTGSIAASTNTGGATTLTVNGAPLTFAVNTTSVGTLTATTTEAAVESGPEEDITVNAGVTIDATAGNVVFNAGDSLVVTAGAVVQSDAGSVSLNAGVGDTDDDALLTLNGTINGHTGASLSGPGDLVLGNISLTTGTLSITSTTGSIRDDGNPNTFIQAPNIILTVAQAIGGDTQIGRDDVLTQDSVFRQAIDFSLLGGTLTLNETGTGGNIQLRDVSGAFDVNALSNYVPAGSGNQLALIASGGAIASSTPGDLVVDAALTLPSAANVNVLLAATDGNNVTVNQAVTNNGASGTTTLAAAGAALTINAAVSSVAGVSLTSTGNGVGAGVAIGANVTASGSGAAITVDANKGVNFFGTATLATTGAAGGAITVTAAENLPNFVTAGSGGITMVAGTGIDTSANNSTITVQAGKAANQGGDLALATVNAGTGTVSASTLNGSITDANGAGTLNVTGGAIILSANGPNGINLDVNTAAPAAGGVVASTANAPITLRSAGRLQVDTINAGTGNVSLTVGNASTTGVLTSLRPNDGAADVTGNTVTLTTNGPTNGSTGQIGFFAAGAKFFEVKATTLNASTDNSRIWLSAINGAAIGSINAGTDDAVLKTTNGNLASTHTGSTPDVTAAQVVLLGTNGSFGSGSAAPLLVQTGMLQASVTSGAGAINVTNVAAGGNLIVTEAQTVNGGVNLVVAAGSLTASRPPTPLTTTISAPGNTVTLSASGPILSTNSASGVDVAATSLAVLNAMGVGTSANPLKTALTSASGGTFAANVGASGVFVNNTGPTSLTIGSAAGVNGVTASGGAITISTNTSLTVAKPVATTGAAVTLSGDTAGTAGNITVNAAINGSAATVLGGGGASTFLVGATGSTPLNVVGGAGNDEVVVSSPTGDLSALVAPIHIDAGGGTNMLFVNDPGRTGADTVVVTGTTISDTGGPLNISYTATGGTFATGVTVVAGSGANTIIVGGTAANAPTLVVGGAGNDNFIVTSPTDTLDTLKSLLNINAGGGANSLFVNEPNRPTADAAAITASSISGQATTPFTILYGATGGTFMNGVTFVGSNAGNTIDIYGTAANAPTNVVGGAGNDNFVVTSATNTLDTLKSSLNINAGAGVNSLFVDAAGATAADALTMTGSSIASSVLHYAITFTAPGGSFANGVTLVTGNGANTINVAAQAPGAPTHIVTGSGNDQVFMDVTTLSAYSLLLSGGSGANALDLIDLSGGGLFTNTPTGPNAGLASLTYPGGAYSYALYSNFGTVV